MTMQIAIKLVGCNYLEWAESARKQIKENVRNREAKRAATNNPLNETVIQQNEKLTDEIAKLKKENEEIKGMNAEISKGMLEQLLKKRTSFTSDSSTQPDHAPHGGIPNVAMATPAMPVAGFYTTAPETRMMTTIDIKK